MEPIKAKTKNFWLCSGNGPPAEKTKRLGPNPKKQKLK
jgi:hypothetical protein